MLNLILTHNLCGYCAAHHTNNYIQASLANSFNMTNQGTHKRPANDKTNYHPTPGEVVTKFTAYAGYVNLPVGGYKTLGICPSA